MELKKSVKEEIDYLLGKNSCCLVLHKAANWIAVSKCPKTGNTLYHDPIDGIIKKDVFQWDDFICCAPLPKFPKEN